MVEYLSVSQLKTYQSCPYSWYLSKVQRVRQTPAAWFPQGSADHKAWEFWEKSGRTATLAECEEVFTAAYDEEVNKYGEETPNFDHWFDSGRWYPAEMDIPRRHDIGLGYVSTYLDYFSDAGPDLTPLRLPNGEPAAEVQFEIELDSTKVRGAIDLLFPSFVVDGKTGVKPPEDDLQLGVYRVAAELEYGWSIPQGFYWMAKTGKPHKVWDLRPWTRERVSDIFGQLAADIDAEKFEARPEADKCRRCSVQHACAFVAL